MTGTTLVTGVSGFVGGELAARLLADGHDVRGLSRDPARAGDLGFPVVRGDAASGAGLGDALRGIDVAYYLVHSLERGNTEGFAAKDRRAVDNFVAAATAAGVGRIVYLGVNHPPEGTALSAHLRSRFEVEDRLLRSGLDAVSVRANFLVSERNPQFRQLVATVEAFPAILLPPWHEARLSPLDSRDVVSCLVAAAGVAAGPAGAGVAYEVGGGEVVTFGGLLTRVASAMGLEREVIAGQLRAEDVTPELVSAISGLDPAYIGPLLETSRLDLVPPTNEVAALGVARPVPLDDALHHALRSTQRPTTPRSAPKALEPR